MDREMDGDVIKAKRSSWGFFLCHFLLRFSLRWFIFGWYIGTFWSWFYKEVIFVKKMGAKGSQ